MKSKKDQNSLQFMHDILLNKLMLEDYAPFPPKNEEPIIVNNQKEEKKKDVMIILIQVIIIFMLIWLLI